MAITLDQLPLSWSGCIGVACIVLVLVAAFRLVSQQAVPTLQVDLSEGDQAVMRHCSPASIYTNTISCRRS